MGFSTVFRGVETAFNASKDHFRYLETRVNDVNDVNLFYPHSFYVTFFHVCMS